MKNYFYVFEGIDGCGKTTLINALKLRLKDKFFYFTKEPFGTSLSNNIKKILTDVTLENDYISQYLFFAAERSYHIKTIIQPYLNKNYNVISDRFFYSSLVYQGISIDENFMQLVYDKSNYGVEVNKIFFCKIDYKIALERIKQRNINDELDNHYQDKLALLASRYDFLFEKNTLVVVLDMTKPVELLIEQILLEL